MRTGQINVGIRILSGEHLQGYVIDNDGIFTLVVNGRQLNKDEALLGGMHIIATCDDLRWRLDKAGFATVSHRREEFVVSLDPYIVEKSKEILEKGDHVISDVLNEALENWLYNRNRGD